jgi:hypothetical protein
VHFAGKASVDVEGECSGDWTGGQIVDRVKIPANLPAGDYVLGWVGANPILKIPYSRGCR